jgi:tetrahydromethanopterin S-methyltransferase subunit G
MINIKKTVEFLRNAPGLIELMNDAILAIKARLDTLDSRTDGEIQKRLDSIESKLSEFESRFQKRIRTSQDYADSIEKRFQSIEDSIRDLSLLQDKEDLNA